MADVPVIASELPVFREQLDDKGVYVAAADVNAWSAAIVSAFNASASTIAAAQYRKLAPDQAWLDFSQAVRELLS